MSDEGDEEGMDEAPMTSEQESMLEREILIPPTTQRDGP